MSMTRREMLTRVLGAAAAAAVAPLVDLTDATPAFWNQEPIRKLAPWKIAFPDGSQWTFEAQVVTERVTDELIEFSLRPTGPMKLEPPEPITWVGEPKIVEPGRMQQEMSVPIRFDATNLHLPDGEVVEVRDIELPQIELEAIEAESDWLSGLSRRGTFTMHVKFI